MAEAPHTTPVEDSVPKVGEIAVGEDLPFQRRWWVFERVVWAFFLVIIVCDVAGLFGRGWLAKAKAATPDGSLSIDYERIERASTPSTMLLHFGSTVIRQGHVKVYVSDSVVKGLGAVRIAPQPAISAVGQGGITYTFAATTSPAEAEIQLEPTEVGRHHFRLQVADQPPIDASVFVVP